MVSRKDIRFTKIRNHKGWTIHYAHLDWYDKSVAVYGRNMRFLRQRVLDQRKQLDHVIGVVTNGMQWVTRKADFKSEQRTAARLALKIIAGEVLNDKGKPTVDDLAEQVVIALIGGKDKTDQQRNKYFWKQVDDGKISQSDVHFIKRLLLCTQGIQGHSLYSLYMEDYTKRSDSWFQRTHFLSLDFDGDMLEGMGFVEMPKCWHSELDTSMDIDVVSMITKIETNSLDRHFTSPTTPMFDKHRHANLTETARTIIQEIEDDQAQYSQHKV